MKSRAELTYEVNLLRQRLDTSRMKEIRLLDEILELRALVRELEKRCAITEYYHDRNTSGQAALAP